jgi:hypothetical protein
MGRKKRNCHASLSGNYEMLRFHLNAGTRRTFAAKPNVLRHFGRDTPAAAGQKLWVRPASAAVQPGTKSLPDEQRMRKK